MKRDVLFGVSFALVCVLGLLCAARPAVAGITERVSVASDGTEGNGDSGYTGPPPISVEGRFVAFSSRASNLVADDTNGQEDVFVHDRQADQTTRVSVASDGTQGNNESGHRGISISADGRFVAFWSYADNLVEGDTNERGDVFVHDCETGQTTLASVASDGVQGGGSDPSISADGRFVAFHSGSDKLVPGDTNEYTDVFVHDRQTGETTRVSVASDGTQGNYTSEFPRISADGQHVAFRSPASNLVLGDTNGKNDTFVHDRQTGTTELVSVASDGTQGNEESGRYSIPAISADGRFVAFWSDASNLVDGDMNGASDVFVRDRQAGTTERVSVASDGVQGNDDSWLASISGDGRFVAFYSFANNLVDGDTNGTWDVFVHDRQVGTTERVSTASDGVQGNDLSFDPSMSADGRFVTFNSRASNLVLGDTNGACDVFVHDRSGVNLTVTTLGSGTGTVELSPPGGGYEEGATVTLTAQPSAGSAFDHWEGDLSGSDNPATILMDGHKTVIAYLALLRQLTVLSAPTDGAAITGDEPGTTPYTTICTDQQLVHLTAPATMSGGSSRVYHFLYWLVGYEPQPYGERELQLLMDSDHTAVAVYDWRLPGDVTGDCLVNVLDMIFVRNHARTACSE